jgi:hypothetical protein
MWVTIIVVIFSIMLTMILHDITRILKLQDELMKEHYVMRGELNAILDMASIRTSFLPKFSFSETEFKEPEFPEQHEKDQTTTVEVSA